MKNNEHGIRGMLALLCALPSRLLSTIGENGCKKDLLQDESKLIDKEHFVWSTRTRLTGWQLEKDCYLVLVSRSARQEEGEISEESFDSRLLSCNHKLVPISPR